MVWELLLYQGLHRGISSSITASEALVHLKRTASEAHRCLGHLRCLTEVQVLVPMPAARLEVRLLGVSIAAEWTDVVSRHFLVKLLLAQARVKVSPLFQEVQARRPSPMAFVREFWQGVHHSQAVTG